LSEHKKASHNQALNSLRKILSFRSYLAPAKNKLINQKSIGRKSFLYERANPLIKNFFASFVIQHFFLFFHILTNIFYFVEWKFIFIETKTEEQFIVKKVYKRNFEK